MDENRNVKQSLVIKNRNLVTIDGVNNVEGFDEGYVALSSTAGRIINRGLDKGRRRNTDKRKN